MSCKIFTSSNNFFSVSLFVWVVLLLLLFLVLLNVWMNERMKYWKKKKCFQINFRFFFSSIKPKINYTSSIQPQQQHDNGLAQSTYIQIPWTQHNSLFFFFFAYISQKFLNLSSCPCPRGIFLRHHATLWHDVSFKYPIIKKKKFLDLGKKN